MLDSFEKEILSTDKPKPVVPKKPRLFLFSTFLLPVFLFLYGVSCSKAHIDVKECANSNDSYYVGLCLALLSTGIMLIGRQIHRWATS